MTEPTPEYNIPQAVARKKLARRRVLITELVALESELLRCGFIERPTVVSRRMLHNSRMVQVRERRIEP